MYVIGDVHGCYKTLCALIEQFPNKYDEEICFVGDLIDRGPNSKDVVKLIREKNYHCVLGNHEKMAIDFDGKPYEEIGNYLYKNLFGGNGGIATLKSYKDIDEFREDIEYFKDLPIFKVFDIKDENNKKLIVSHSSAGSFLNNDLQFILDPILHKSNKDVEENIIWNREILTHINSYSSKNIKEINGYFNIFGHTIFDHIVLSKSFACIDTGVISNRTLTAIEYPSLKTYKQLLLDY